MKYVGIDIGGTNLKAGLVDEQGNLLASKKIKIAQIDNQESLAWAMASMTQELAEAVGVPVNEIASVGVGVPGTVEIHSGSILYTCNLPLRNVPLRRLFHRYLPQPLYIENDANCAAVGEYFAGAGHGSKRFVAVTLGTGVGGGVIHNGKIYHGANGMAGEAGHIRLAQDGPVGYGKAGSFEGFCSGGGISRLGSLMGCPGTAKELADRAKNGDMDALRVYRASARKLGAGLSVLIDLFNPERIVIGSVFARSEELFREEMEKVIAEEALAEAAAVCTVVPAALGDAIGDWAAVAVAQRGLEEQHV